MGGRKEKDMWGETTRVENRGETTRGVVIFLQIGNSGSWVPLKLKSMGHLWNSWVPYRNVLFSE